MTDSSVREPTAVEPRERIDYLELDVLWGDHGPVARVLLRNSSAVPGVEEVQVFAEHARDRRRIGAARVRVPARGAVAALIELDRDFPQPAAWLRLASGTAPVRVWAGRDATRLRIRTDVER